MQTYPVISRAVRTGRLFAAGLLLAGGSARADYQDVMDFFTGLNTDTVFPVADRSLADVESAFGPRIQTSGGNYDWHRGIDIDGTLNTSLVVAPLAGYLHRYQFESASSGYTVILRHELSDFGVPSLTYEGATITRFYTWYSHLYDDGVANNGVGTGDQYMNLANGTAIAQGATIGILGDSGTPANGGSYGPHLHFELRVGSNASLQFQLDNPMTTQWGFDPHINPMVLFDPATFSPGEEANYEQGLDGAPTVQTGEDIVLLYTNGTDELPLLNRVEVRIIDTFDESVAKLHVLDYNLRVGYDASSTAALDTLDSTKPYVDPVAFGDTADEFQAEIVIPDEWLAGFEGSRYRVETRAVDIYGEFVTQSATVIPEPASYAALAGVFSLAWRACRRRRG